MEHPDLLHKCAHQKLLESPFDEHEVADLRKDNRGVWYWNGRRATDGTSRSTGGFFFGLVLAASERDVDAEGIGSFASGVAVGVGVKLPRILLFFKKEKMAAPIPAQTAGAARGSNGAGCVQSLDAARRNLWGR